jgi:hypothetical protein
MKHAGIALLVMILFPVLLPTVSAIIGPVDDEKLISTSDIIVVGKITEIREGGSRRNSKSFALIEVTEVLKSKKRMKQVRLTFPSRNRRFRETTEIYYSKDQEGIWFLRKAKIRNYYFARHYNSFQPLSELEKVRLLLGKGKPVSRKTNGLDPWKKDIIDHWIAMNDLNRYGDPKGTVYLGGTPLFDEKAGQYMDRYEYIYLYHPEVRKLLADKSKESRNP